MIRVSLPWIFDIVKAIDELDNLVTGKPISDFQWPLSNAKNSLQLLFEESVYSSHLRVSRQKAVDLIAVLEPIIQTISKNDGSEFSDSDTWNIFHRRNEFRTVFLSEISMLPVFLVTPKESYDIGLLIEYGSTLFPTSMTVKAPETIPDAMEVGKALAFELSTACGFHVFRLLESVIKRYWDAVGGGAARPKLQTIGNYAHEFIKQDFGEPKIAATLKQIAKLHRNPLIHPEVILTVEEAIGIIGISRSVIGMMLGFIPDPPMSSKGQEVSAFDS